ncbi:MAG TPA: efflux RND transporter periplasmic adaptor subunit [Candidatus Methylomirabilis sp.]|nr:efflux RND transporter periplasmic adaptor subunit [Candidatus Methylomirabilis sp.]
MLPVGLDVTGALMADAQTDVASEIDGRVTQVLVERGLVVKEGTVLVRMDDRDAINQLHEAEATEAQTRERLGLVDGEYFDPLKTPDVRQARAVMDRAEADYQRFKQLLDEGAISRSEHDLRRTDSLTAKAQYESTINQVRQLFQTLQAQKARVAMARKALEDTVIRAPFSGQVSEKHVNVGRYAKKGDKLVTLVRVDPLRVELAVPEAAVASIQKGQKVSFTVQTHPDRPFAGTIAYVGPALRTDSRALVVEALVPNASGHLQPGLFATARIELPATRPSVLVPAGAVQTEAGVARVFVTKGDRAELRFVQVGREAGGLVEILRGVTVGERVVVQAGEGLADGAAITEAK